MRVTVIQHSKSGHAGLIGDYLVERAGATLDVVRSDEGRELTLADVRADAVVVMGSARGVYETEIPWVMRQRALMKEMVDEGVPVFGVCFGAQLLATALGGDVKPTGDFYLGWRGNEEPAEPIWQGPWLRWHGDHVSLPDDVKIHARADGLVQAFQRGPAVGVQFHPEASADMLDLWAVEAGLKGAFAEKASTASAHARGDAVRLREEAYRLFDHVFGLLRGEKAAAP